MIEKKIGENMIRLIFGKPFSFMFVVLPFYIVISEAVVFNANAEEKTILAITEPWPPYMGPELKDNGFFPELVSEAFKRVGYTVKMEFYPWARVIAMMKKGKADVIYGVYHSKEREQFLIYSKPILEVQEVLISMKGRKITYQKLTDLKLYKIGVVREAVHEKAFDAADYLKKYEDVNHEQNIKLLVIGRIDLMAGSRDVIFSIVRQKYPQYLDQIEVVIPPLSKNKAHIGFSKKAANSRAVSTAFDKALTILKKDGSFSKIANKHGIKVIP